MACADLGPDLYSEKTSFQIRSHKLNQQRNLIEEKNGNKKKFSGKVISLYNQQSVFSNSRFFLQPCTIDNTQTLSYPSNTNGNNSSSGSTHDSLPIPLVTDHLLIQASSSISNASIKDLEKIEFTPVSSFESPVISPTADPYSLVPYAHEQSSNPVLGETIILDIDGKYSISESIDHLEEPPELIPLSTSSVVCMPKDLELPKFILTPVKHNQVYMI
ncbi:hypothetical protein LOD99_1815 [Oopsacas minuta]|uniref:Uncharacterized protein n=1 Tax=Oopsacas minuta TaxID=111878 RepID=A0AAV7K4Z6_9METZ|nr:hypothetical protein LOD99_1815 [Oopsacas minuta]